jgi:integrase
MTTGRISIGTVKTLKPTGKDIYLWDSELRGFGLKVTPAGKRTYLVQYRLGGRRGRTRRVTIGQHGSPWTPDKAREQAKLILGQVANKEDPAEDRARARQAITVAELCDLYLSEGVANKKASTVSMDHSRIELHVKPLLGNRRARNISQDDVERLLNVIAKRAGKGAASRTVGMLGGIFSFAVRKRLCNSNPVRGVERFPDKKVERFLNSSELARLGEVLTSAEGEGINPYAIAAIRMLVFTGCRKAEVLTLRWDHIDWYHGCLRLPDSKTGAKTVALGAPAIELLNGLNRVEGNPYVFPGTKDSAHLVGLQKIWERLRKRAELSDLRLHDLRQAIGAVLDEIDHGLALATEEGVADPGMQRPSRHPGMVRR